MNFRALAVGLTTCALFVPSLKAQDSDAASARIDVDSMLERLESHLLEQEGAPLTYEDAKTPKKAHAPVYEYPKEDIVGSIPETDGLKTLATRITALENQVDELASDVQKTKQDILESAKINNVVEVAVALSDSSAAAIRALAIKIDGFAVYNLDEKAGAWLPDATFPIYQGPMQPGDHRIDLEARLVLKHKDGMPLNSDVYRFVNKRFSLTVPSGTIHKRWTIDIKPPAALDEQPTATLDNANAASDKG